VSTPLRDDDLATLDAYWRAANYLSVGQIYLLANPLLEEALTLEHVKPRLLGHWGTTPGLNFVYAHLNRAIKARELPMLLVIGPGHGGPALVANTWLEGSYSEIYPDVSRDAEGMRRLFKQFSFPGGIPSHCAPEIPGTINEGGELGYSLAHAFGAAFDNPELVVVCVVGDGEAETGALAASWHSNKFLNPVDDGAVLPILHLNGWKIANPTVLARISEEELADLMRGYGWDPRFVSGDEPMPMHRAMAAALDTALDDIAAIKAEARRTGATAVPRWPMLVLRTPKGWTGPKEVDGKPVEDTWRSHQVPLSGLAKEPAHLRALEQWLKSYRPEELFDADGAPRASLLGHVPNGTLRLGATPYSNGGVLRRPLRLPDYRSYAVEVPQPGAVSAEATRVLGRYLRDVFVANRSSRNFLLFGPDETESNRLMAVYEATPKRHIGPIKDVDRDLAADGRVFEILSEHLCQGWLEGYLLTGRHGFFSCYEAFVHIVDSMFNQHAKWLKVSQDLPWRRPISSLNYLLTSHVWRQDHNGFSHQDPGFIDHVVNKKADVIRVYLPPDANTLLAVAERALRSTDLVNVIVAGKQNQPQWLDMTAATRHVEAGIGIWPWASSDGGGEPEVVMACAGDVPTLETLAAVSLLRELFPDLAMRVVNIVDLMTLQPPSEHPHGLSDRDFDAIFTRDKPIIFAYHGYPWLIHRLTYRRTNHDHLHVRGYKEEGTTTTPFDMVVRNDLDRFHLVADVAQRVPRLAPREAHTRQLMRDRLAEHRDFIRKYGEDLPEIRDWTWGEPR
jgi:xylulose-5-phosphate/fructose-6-phosphate phosphoketolase